MSMIPERQAVSICYTCSKHMICYVNNDSMVECEDFKGPVSRSRIIRKTKVKCKKCPAHIIIKNMTVESQVKCPLCKAEYIIKQQIQFKTVIEPVRAT